MMYDIFIRACVLFEIACLAAILLMMADVASSFQLSNRWKYRKQYAAMRQAILESQRLSERHRTAN